MIELDSLYKNFGPVRALDGLSLTIPAGQLFGFLGPNGSGKTTTMRAMLGILALDGGELIIDGVKMSSLERISFGYMPEERGLYPKMTVSDHLDYLARLYGYTSREATLKSKIWIDRFELGQYFRTKIEALSLGNKQKVQLAAALVHNPQILLLDEPFSGLDPIAVDIIKSVLEEAASEGKYVVFSSHQLDLVESICESAAIVDRGRLLLEGSVRTLTTFSTNGKKVIRVRVSNVTGVSNWINGRPDIELLSQHSDSFAWQVPHDFDERLMLKEILEISEVSEYGVDRKTLSEAFLQAVTEDRRSK